MATIPTGNFGQAIARPGPQVQIAGSSPLTEAGARAAQTGMAVQIGEAQQETDLAEQRRRAQASLTLAKTANDLHDAHDEVARGVLDGSVPIDKARGMFQERAGKINSANMDGWDPLQREQMDAHLMQTVGGLDRSLNNVVRKREQTDIASTIDQFGEQVSREAMRVGPGWAVQKFGAMVDFTGAGAGLNEAQRSKVKQSFQEKVTHEFFSSAGTAALTQGDAEAVRGVRAKVEGADGEAMDPKQRTQLTLQLFGYEQSILAKHERAANAAETEQRRLTNLAVDVFNKGTEVALNGGFFSPEFINELSASAAGTEMEGPARDLIASQRSIAGFATKSAPARAAELERMRAARATPGIGTDPLGDKVYRAANEVDSRLRQQADDNPWKAAQGAGVIQDAPTINPADPQQAITLLQQRMREIGRVEQWTGKRASPFQPEEIENVGKMVRSLPIDQAATMLSRFGEVMGNSERVATAAKQLHDKDGVLGLAMMFANSKTTQGRTTAELVLRGAQAEKDGSIKPDAAKETGWKATIATEVRGAYTNREAEDNVVRAAFLIAGANGGDVDNAVLLATGGVVNFNGSKVPLPYGMASGGLDDGEKKFRKAIEAVAPETITAQAPDGQVRAGPAVLSIDEFVRTLPDARLIHGGQGLYYVRAGNTMVTNAQGKPIGIRIAP
jgi:hypothetical protein